MNDQSQNYTHSIEETNPLRGILTARDDENVIVMWTGDHIYYSGDGGNSWETILEGVAPVSGRLSEARPSFFPRATQRRDSAL